MAKTFCPGGYSGVMREGQLSTTGRPYEIMYSILGYFPTLYYKDLTLGQMPIAHLQYKNDPTMPLALASPCTRGSMSISYVHTINSTQDSNVVSVHIYRFGERVLGGYHAVTIQVCPLFNITPRRSRS